VNLCACTPAHRDKGDLRLCVVMPFGDFEGGELVLYESRLVIAAKAGDIIIFPSCSVTHFNLHFVGERGSLVLHTHRAAEHWIETFNDWDGHISRNN
jgi:predicted 2-oxoglutarate/Fe(II)-dependent dioxygenase YbiX